MNFNDNGDVIALQFLFVKIVSILCILLYMLVFYDIFTFTAVILPFGMYLLSILNIIYYYYNIDSSRRLQYYWRAYKHCLRLN